MMTGLIPVLVVVSVTQAMQPITIKTADMELGLLPRSPDQIISFYEARGFPKPMREVLKKQCFITTGISNHSNTKIWLDLDSWVFHQDGKPIKRYHRNEWKQRWQQMDIPMSKQSTFRWTLLPETLDYLPGEHEGGNVILPFTEGYFSLKATFKTGDDKQGKVITITIDKLYCAEDAAEAANEEAR